MSGYLTAPITVIIPTRNRGHTIADTLKSCVGQDADCRFIVSDNCSEDDTEDVVRSFNDPRITFVRTSRVLSMEASFDFALSHAPEGYLYSIGGDDALCPEGIRRLGEVIKETGSPVIRPRLINYHWDNYPDPTHQQIATNVAIGDGWSWMDSRQFLQAIADDLMRHAYFYEHAPSFYHGCVHSSLLSSIWPSPQPIIRSKVPDMFGGVLIASQVQRFVLLDTPVSLNAMSCSSNGVPQFLRQGLEKGDGRSFWAEVDYPYEPELVRSSSNPDIVLAMPLLLADQFLKVRKMGHQVPEITMEQVVAATIRGACRWHSREQYDGALRIARETASIHGLQDLAEQFAQKHPFKERPRSRRRTTFDVPAKIYRALDLAPMGATGAHSAGNVIRDIRAIHQRQVQNQAKCSLQNPRRKLAELAGSREKLHLWLLARSFSTHIKGRVVLACDNVPPAINEVLFNPPSLAIETVPFPACSADALPKFDCVMAAGQKIDHNHLLSLADDVFVVQEKIDSMPVQPPGWQFTTIPLQVTRPEQLLLALHRRLKYLAPFFVRLLAPVILPRLAGQRHASRQSSLLVSHWKRL